MGQTIRFNPKAVYTFLENQQNKQTVEFYKSFTLFVRKLKQVSWLPFSSKTSCNEVEPINYAFLMVNLKSKLTTVHQGSEAIILLHGLARTSHSMSKAGKLFAALGYKIINVSYPSQKFAIETFSLVLSQHCYVGS